ncbi:dienelactone hydrolase family protein [Streptacidiphilus neutrinimicus]|uniref:dienelactone hydrolase family protein n=1 Tax=Streptacidiphilus neutrinimicus TaxID=105420 RepID=UPI0005A60D59|nr:dienelactone hydrolase family protein [Streptacidiphilus neutrinimicus]
MPAVTVRDVVIGFGGEAVHGDLALPPSPPSVVVFAHGSGSSRFSPRNRTVAAVLQRAGLGTLLLDLLTASEERIDDVTCRLRFDIPLLARRLVAAVDWLDGESATAELPVGLFGASTGAAAALRAAAERPARVSAVVSRGGRPDLAGEALARVRAPVLLLVGGLDQEVLRLNRAAADRLTAPWRLVVVPGATHLFAEPGTLEQVSAAARDWFLDPEGTPP